MLLEEQATKTERDEIGRSVPMLDGTVRITGKTVFTFDLEIPRMLYAKVKRSPHPHAMIRSIDISRAKNLPGVRAVICGNDLPDALFGPAIRDTPAMARDRVRYIGEPVAAVAADTQSIADQAIELIDPIYEELPAIFDAEEAMTANPKAIIHPDLKKYEFSQVIGPSLDEGLPNVGYHFKIRLGDVDRAFREADVVIENRYSSGMMHTLPLEPAATVAKVDPMGDVTVWASTQSPFRIRSDICQAFLLPETKVRVIAVHSSGGYGSKLAAHSEPICVALALATGRAVKLLFTREETFAATTVKHPFVVYVKDGITKDGRLVAREVKAILNGGAYSGGSGVWVTRNCAFAALGSYKIPNFRFDSYRPYTNHPPGGPYRGFGSMQVDWALEAQMDILAKAIELDPIEFRKRNALHEGDINIIGERMHSVTSNKCLDAVGKSIGWGNSKIDPEWPWRRGIGIAEANKYSIAPTAASAIVKLREDETLEVHVGAPDTGMGTHTILAQMVSHEFGFPLEKVRVLTPDTSISPFDEGAFSSRQTYNTGNAVLLACKNLKKELIDRAASKFGVQSSILEMKGETIRIIGDSQRVIRLRDLFDKLRFGSIVDQIGEFSGKATWNQRAGGLDPEMGQCETDRACAFYTSSAQAVELDVNLETGHVRINRLACAIDVGKAINKKMLEGQVQGGLAMSIAGSLFEEMVLRQGQILNEDFMDYKAPTSLEMPASIDTIVLETPHKDGPFGAKGAGEAPLLATAPAIANAIYDAIGIRLFDLPMTAERVLEALAKKKDN